MYKVCVHRSLSTHTIGHFVGLGNIFLGTLGSPPHTVKGLIPYTVRYSARHAVFTTEGPCRGPGDTVYITYELKPVCIHVNLTDDEAKQGEQTGVSCS